MTARPSPIQKLTASGSFPKASLAQLNSNVSSCRADNSSVRLEFCDQSSFLQTQNAKRSKLRHLLLNIMDAGVWVGIVEDVQEASHCHPFLVRHHEFRPIVCDHNGVRISVWGRGDRDLRRPDGFAEKQPNSQSKAPV